MSQAMQTHALSSKRNLPLILAFGAFSYVLLSTWGALVAENLAVVLSERRLVACLVGAGLFWLAVSRLRQRNDVSLSKLIAIIVGAGLVILAVRLGLDQLSPHPVTADHSIRWSLAWSGYFGIWLLAVVPPCAPPTGEGKGPDPVELSALPDVYLEQLFKLPDDKRGA